MTNDRKDGPEHRGGGGGLAETVLDYVDDLLGGEPAAGPWDKEPILPLEDVQGDILIGLQKFNESLLLFEITDAKRFGKLLRKLPFTSAREAYKRERKVKDRHPDDKEARIATPGLGVAFTFSGLQKLGLEGLDALPADHPFRQGMAARAASLNDPDPATWEFAKAADSGRLHGVFVVTGSTEAEVKEIITDELSDGDDGFRVFDRLDGCTRPGDRRGHEHFGFLDGVSQPGLRGRVDRHTPVTPRHDPVGKPSQGIPGQDVLWPGEFLFGYAGQKAGATFEEEGPVAVPPAPWMRDGAFLVVRRLEQLVPEMQQSVREAARDQGMDPELLGAQMVGRWQSGAPIINAPLADDPDLGKSDETKNDFEFKGDREGKVCPWAAHIRKTYPRDDVRHNTSPSGAEEKQAEAFTHTRRMMRRGIAFGPEVSDAERLAGRTRHDRGLVFKCYVTDLFEQFEFVQTAWANADDFGQPDSGVDPIIGQAAGGGSRRFKGVAPARPEFDFAPWVLMTGGAYFFAPSLPLLRSGLGD